jgi:hypothetical protein
MKILSRLTDNEEQFQRLREIMEAATGGAIAEGGDLEPEDTLTGLVRQVDITCASLLQMIDQLERENARLSNIAVSQHVAMTELRDAFDQDVQYDEVLDHATMDFMDALLASGVAESTFDGEISFVNNVIMSKQDIKPILREAVSTWVRLKIQ